MTNFRAYRHADHVVADDLGEDFEADPRLLVLGTEVGRTASHRHFLDRRFLSGDDLRRESAHDPQTGLGDDLRPFVPGQCLDDDADQGKRQLTVPYRPK